MTNDVTDNVVIPLWENDNVAIYPNANGGAKVKLKEGGKEEIENNYRKTNPCNEYEMCDMLFSEIDGLEMFRSFALCDNTIILVEDPVYKEIVDPETGEFIDYEYGAATGDRIIVDCKRVFYYPDHIIKLATEELLKHGEIELYETELDEEEENA